MNNIDKHDSDLLTKLIKYEKYKLRSTAMLGWEPEWKEEMRDAAVEVAELALSIWGDEIVFNYHGIGMTCDEYFRCVNEFGD